MTIWTADDFIADHTGLDFLNTVGDQDKRRNVERLQTWQDVLDWAAMAGILDGDEHALLRDSRNAGATLESLRTLRETVHAMLSAHARGVPSPEPAMHAFHRAVQDALSVAVLVESGAGYRWHVATATVGPETVRHRIVLSLWTLIQGPDLGRLRECGNCSWLFLNTGRGVGRRWCRMAACGNRTKARRFRTAHNRGAESS